MASEGNWDSTNYSQKMKDGQNELFELQTQLNDVMIKFILRALRVYQSTRPEPLRPGEIALLVNNELKNVLYDLQAQPNLDALAKAAKEAWANEQKP
ncbi:hypothetical protein [Candidatus Bathycorpusculum sp.]|jgi:hypothetical protein|uniref:hypothetical protein n=1 Tax=Candidatus Bathycorpusculum sp. TaxID=2994959 RepID=UPI0028231640|nr:hypothetical protein [Candidatus Termitimicrobium sp.]MCL2686864.1 hypothetical protein [Candidatus Termitimicrobium sp.]